MPAPGPVGRGEMVPVIDEITAECLCAGRSQFQDGALTVAPAWQGQAWWECEASGTSRARHPCPALAPLTLTPDSLRLVRNASGNLL